MGTGHSRRTPASADESCYVLKIATLTAGSNRSQVGKFCGWHVFRYRVVKGVIYADHNHKENGILRGQRDAFLEMLITAVWLYKAFPDVELWVSFSDEPSRCTLNIPVLQYTILDRATTKAAAGSRVADIDGAPFSITQLLTGGGEEPAPGKPAPSFHRGWAINHPGVWDKLSLLPSALQHYQQCLKDSAGGRASVQRVFWRGGNTGFNRGRPPLEGPLAKILQHPWGYALINKRVAVALLARSYPDIMDVGLHEVLPELLPEGKQANRLTLSKVSLLSYYGIVDLLWSFW